MIRWCQGTLLQFRQTRAWDLIIYLLMMHLTKCLTVAKVADGVQRLAPAYQHWFSETSHFDQLAMAYGYEIDCHQEERWRLCR